MKVSKSIFLLYLSVVCVNYSCNNNTAHLEDNTNECADKQSRYISSMDASDLSIISSLKNDTTEYDPSLVLKPFEDSEIRVLIQNSETVDTLKETNGGVILEFKSIGTDIIVYQDNNGEREILFLSSESKGFSLANTIKIGSCYTEVERKYKRGLSNASVLCIIEESEMAEVKLFFKKQMVEKITYVNYESCYYWGIL